MWCLFDFEFNFAVVIALYYNIYTEIDSLISKPNKILFLILS